jgi:hypothetical protein
MDTSTIDYELEHYVEERLATNNREAYRRLYFRAVAHCSGPLLADYLESLRAHAAVYASISHMLRLPFCHIESPLFLSSVTLFVAGIVMIACGEFSLLVAGGTSAAVVGMIRCGQRYFKLWLKHCVREAVFLELAETLRQECGSGFGKQMA